MELALKRLSILCGQVGLSRPDHYTLYRFRSIRLTIVLKEIFAQVVNRKGVICNNMEVPGN
jgi:hypothetical protein